MKSPDWIAADWGTSNLRLWGIDAAGDVLFARTSDRGMSRVVQKDYPHILAELLDGQVRDVGPPLPVVICGMAGARQGWVEAPYLRLPANLDALGTKAVQPVTPDNRLAPHILPGLAATEAGHEDVMRGEETQLLGLVALHPDFTGIVCMPGTHSKWVTVADRAVMRFETAMTGELFDLLAHQSVLRHALAGDEIGPHLEDGIDDGLVAGLAAPERLTTALFRTRAAALLSDRSADWCRGYLSGLLVGAEIAAHRHWRTDAPVALIGADRLCRLYASALKRDGATSLIVDAEAATRAGLDAARRQIASA